MSILGEIYFMSILDGNWRRADEKTLNASWLGGPKGIYFRCAFCGYKFQLGDPWRIQFSNNIYGAWGNPLVCKECDEPDDDLIEKWKEKRKLWEEMHNPNGEWWWFAI